MPPHAIDKGQSAASIAKLSTSSRILRASLNWIPLFRHLRHYAAVDLINDALAGSVTAILTIPQAIAYALLAGLPAQMGLYAAIVAPIVYAVVGSGRTIIIGPAAVQSAMVAAVLVPLAGTNPAIQIAGALMIALMSGVMLFSLGLLRLGWLTHFISNPVLSGFTTGAVLYIIITQCGTLVGIPLPRDGSPIDAVKALALGLTAIHPMTAACGVAATALLLFTRNGGATLAQRLGASPQIGAQIGRVSPLIVVLLFAALSSALGLAKNYKVAVVGSIPGGLPHLRIAIPVNLDWHALLPGAILIGLVGYIETLSIAKALAFRRRERIDPDRELVALGLTNLAVAAFGAMPVAGSFSKSIVNFESGARTQLSGIIAATWLMVSALLLAGLLHELPRTVLAAIIIVAVSRLLDFKSLRETWRYDKGDGSAQAITIASVLYFGVELGLLIGTGVAAALFLHRTSRPRILAVGHVPGTQHFRDVHRSDVATIDRWLLIRVDENLYYANTPRVETELQRLVAEHANATDVVLILSGIGYIDATSLDMLDHFEQALVRAGVRLHLSEFKSQVIDRLRETALFKRLDPSRIHRSTLELLRLESQTSLDATPQKESSQERY